MIKKTDGDDVLVNGIIDFGELQIVFIVSEGQMVKVGHGLVGDESKKSVGNEFERVFFGLELLRKILNQLGDLVCCSQTFFLMASVGKGVGYFSPADAQTRDGVTTDVGEVVGPGIVVATLQEQAVGKLIPDFEIYADWSEGVRQNFLVFGM